MSTRVIGFIGIDKYEIVQYIGQILSQLRYRVLLVDYTHLQSLITTLSVERYDHQMQHLGMDYLVQPEPGEVGQLLESGDYDYIIMDFDFLLQEKDFFLCREICFVTDLQKHHLELISHIQLRPDAEISFFVKQGDNCKAALCYLEKILQDKKVPCISLFFLKWNEKDMEGQLRFQYQYFVPMHHFSAAFRQLIWQMTAMLTEVPEKRLHQVFKNVERGVLA